MRQQKPATSKDPHDVMPDHYTLDPERWRDESLSFEERSELTSGLREIEKEWEEPEPAPDYDFDRLTPEDKLKWFNQENTAEEIRKHASRTDAGSMTMKAAYTSYIEFHLDEPKGASQKSTCNECWEEFYIPPFSHPVECPFCHARGTNIYSTEHLGGSEEESATA